MSPALPTIEGPYTPLRLLGEGGMGAVWEVEHATTGQHYALKTVSGFDAEDLARFQREAQTLAGLNHPNVVRLHAAELQGQQPYLVQELLAGSLADRLRGGPLSGDQAREVARQVAAGVAAVHATGVLHRDLKPDNVLFSAEGVAKVADFGLAHCAEARERLTRTGAILGTPAFMAPEQAVDARAADERADVYALGALLYATLTGVPPLRTEGRSLIATLSALQSEVPTPPQVLNPQAPGDLSAVCLRALQKDPAQRFPSAKALLTALDGGYAGPGRDPRVLPFVLVVCALVMLGVVLLLRSLVSPAEPQPPRRPPRPPSKALSEVSPSPLAAYRPLFVETRGYEQTVVAFSQAGLLVACDGEVELRPDDPGLPPQTWAYTGAGSSLAVPRRLVVVDAKTRFLCGFQMRVQCIQGERVSELDRSQDTLSLAQRGALFACGRKNGELSLGRFLDSGAPALFLTKSFYEGELKINEVVWLDDERLLLAAKSHESSGRKEGKGPNERELLGTLTLVRCSGEPLELQKVESLDWSGATCVAVDGKGTVAIGATTGAVVLWKDRDPLRTLTSLIRLAVTLPNSCRGLAFTPSGRLIVVSGGDTHDQRRLIVCELKWRGEELDWERRQVSLGDLQPWSLSVDATGERAAVGGELGRVRVYDLRRVWATGVRSAGVSKPGTVGKE